FFSVVVDVVICCLLDVGDIVTKAHNSFKLTGSTRVGDEEVVVGEGVVVTSSSLEMLTNSCLGGIMVSLIFLEGLVEEALEELMVELFEEDDKLSKKYGLFNLRA
nr:hypothetical protein [Tanacetum cinerariifolium]